MLVAKSSRLMWSRLAEAMRVTFSLDLLLFRPA
jgi:hypothetical protein